MIHYHRDTADLPWDGDINADCHEGVGLEAPLTEEEQMEEAMRYDPSTMRDEDGPWGGGFARNH